MQRFTYTIVNELVAVIFDGEDVFGVVRMDVGGNILLADPPLTRMLSSNATYLSKSWTFSKLIDRLNGDGA